MTSLAPRAVSNTNDRRPLAERTEYIEVMPCDPLPIDDALPEVVRSLRGAVVLGADGAGKTTRSRRACRRGLAGGAGPWSRTASRLGWPPRSGAWRSNTAPRSATRTAIRSGSTARRRPGLGCRSSPRASFSACFRTIRFSGVAAVVFDEFHERGLESDHAWDGPPRAADGAAGSAVVVMSATIDFAGPSPRTSAGAGRGKRAARTRWKSATARGSIADRARRVDSRTDGDVLVFPARAIRQLAEPP